MEGDGRCHSPGHCVKYCTYTFLNNASQKVVDFKVLCFRSGKFQPNGTKKGFVDILGHVEANEVKVAVISTDRHPQIKRK